ncbi:hypothetical protein J7M28_12095, partial [bacterium]|nr:hypothetical protein [bacterium]
EDSPCVDAGSMTASDAGMYMKTTRTDDVPDDGVVDIGYHYSPVPVRLPKVQVSTPSDTYSYGDVLEIVFEAVNENPFPYPVDFYAGIYSCHLEAWAIDANGVWSTSPSPCIASLELPANFSFGPTTLLRINLPSEVPPISDPNCGRYFVAAGFARVGTATFLDGIYLSAFDLVGD